LNIVVFPHLKTTLALPSTYRSKAENFIPHPLIWVQTVSGDA